ncbi:MAG TPA: NAD(P)H-dependent oxidoreductase [Phycisphaerae bacterium]|nr:NAD(P)H-dependent oxidoreductase [Phycisphaerae bacterium]
MKDFLHVVASPRGDESFSVRVGRRFLQSLPGVAVETLDLFRADLPPFDAPYAAAKYAVLGGATPADDAQRAWKRVIELADHFKSFDGYVFSAGMWNFGIPYRLKHYLDLVVQPGLTFSYSPQKGYQGLVTGKPAVLALARGADYSPGSGAEAMDMQRPYLEAILRFIGFADIRTIVVQPTLGDERALDAALTEADRIAREFR